MEKLLLVFVLLLAYRAEALTNSVPAEDPFFQNVIYFEAESHLENGESVKSYCNAILISNRYAVTAAHCANMSYIEKNHEIHLMIGKYVYAKQIRTGKTVRIGYKRYLDLNREVDYLFTSNLKKKILRSKKYNIGPEEDFAIIAFRHPLPLDTHFAFAKIIGRDRYEAIKKLYSSDKIVAVTINTVEEVSSSNTKKIASLNRVSWNPFGYFMSVSHSRFAGDDSGGAIFAKFNDEDFLLGVVKGKRQLLNYDVFTPVRDLACLVASENNFLKAEPDLFCP